MLFENPVKSRFRGQINTLIRKGCETGHFLNHRIFEHMEYSMSTSSAPKNKFRGKYWVAADGKPPRGISRWRPDRSEVTTILTQGEFGAGLFQNHAQIRNSPATVNKSAGGDDSRLYTASKALIDLRSGCDLYLEIFDRIYRRCAGKAAQRYSNNKIVSNKLTQIFLAEGDWLFFVSSGNKE